MNAALRILIVVAALSSWAIAIADEPTDSAENAPAKTEPAPTRAASAPPPAAPAPAAASPDTAASAAAPNAAAPDGAAPNPVAPDAAVGVADYIAAVSDRFAAALEKQKLPYVTAVELAGVREQLHDYLARRVKTPLAGPQRAELLETIDKYVERRFSGAGSYLGFRNNFNSLKWQLWTATERPELTADQLKERDRQREWMFAYIRSLPITENEENFPERQPDGRLRALEHEVFDNRLCPFFHDPMSPPEFELFTQRVQAPARYALTGSVSAIFRAAVVARSAALLDRWPPGFRHPDFGALAGENTPNFYYFFFVDINNDMKTWIVGPSKNDSRRYYNVAARGPISQPPPLDEAATAKWLA
ncbi:MAG TPA: hypothetical protein VGG30_02230, partial [Pirellulales bacterium]